MSARSGFASASQHGASRLVSKTACQVILRSATWLRNVPDWTTRQEGTNSAQAELLTSEGYRPERADMLTSRPQGGVLTSFQATKRQLTKRAHSIREARVLEASHAPKSSLFLAISPSTIKMGNATST